MGKLDVEVNGAEDDVLDWDAVDWRRVEDDVRRLRQRIFTATQAGDLKRVRNLQRLMLRSRANALLSVRRVTEVNAGRKTAGVDRRVVVEAGEKADLAAWLQHGATGWQPRPVKRVFIRPVRIQIVWVPTRTQLPGRDAGNLRDRTWCEVSTPVGAA
jgi:RNA-directed DNA polymerase